MELPRVGAGISTLVGRVPPRRRRSAARPARDPGAFPAMPSRRLRRLLRPPGTLRTRITAGACLVIALALAVGSLVFVVLRRSLVSACDGAPRKLPNAAASSSVRNSTGTAPQRKPPTRTAVTNRPAGLSVTFRSDVPQGPFQATVANASGG